MRWQCSGRQPVCSRNLDCFRKHDRASTQQSRNTRQLPHRSASGGLSARAYHVVYSTPPTVTPHTVSQTKTKISTSLYSRQNRRKGGCSKIRSFPLDSPDLGASIPVEGIMEKRHVRLQAHIFCWGRAVAAAVGKRPQVWVHTFDEPTLCARHRPKSLNALRPSGPHKQPTAAALRRVRRKRLFLSVCLLSTHAVTGVERSPTRWGVRAVRTSSR